MTCKIASILATVGALTVYAQAQQSVPKPTKADAVQVVKIISANKTKIATYCKLADLGEEMKNANSAGDNSKLQQLGKQADNLGKSLGPEFVRVNAGLGQVDLQSKEGQEVSAELDKLDKLCPPQ
jgi:predicted extracellular nuclease